MVTESPLKVMKNNFFLRYFDFCCGIYGHVEWRLDKKTTVNLKIHNVTNWLTNDQTISKSTRRNNFLEKSCIKCDGETSLRPFSKNQNWAHLSINSLKFVFMVCPSRGLPKHIPNCGTGHSLLSYIILF